uniref:F-box/LRR-repeat protein 15-like leucin rich repeat domain-containing protein n=1 Tax=Phytophthora ramorum TaxID=164328 RepID=H3GZJ1_PHYRM
MNVKSIDILVLGAHVVMGKWTHLVGTYDGTILRLYVDGLLQNEVEVESVADLEIQKREAVMARTREDIADLEDEAKGACFKETDRETKLFFTSKEGRRQVKESSSKLLDEHEFRVRLSRNADANANAAGSEPLPVKKDASKVSRTDFEPVAKKHLLREKFDARWAVVAAEFKEMRARVNLKIQRQLDDQSNQDARQLRIGCLSSARRRDGKYFFHGNIAHVAYYNNKVLSRDQVNAHYVMGTRDRAHESDHLFALASSRFSRALEYAPDDKRMLEKFAENVCASLKYDLDHRYAQQVYKKKVRCGLKPFVATDNAHGIAEVLKNLPRDPVFSDLFLLCYHSLVKIQPRYFQATESQHCRLSLRQLGRLPFAFFLGSRSADSLVNIMSCAMKHLATMLASPAKLRRLNVGGCRRIGDEGLLEVAKVCSGLQQVNVRLCDRLTDLSVRALTHNCLELESLDLEELHSLSYRVFVFDQEGDGRGVVDKNLLLKLKSLNVNGCSGLNDLALGHVGHRAKALESLRVSACTDLSDQGLGWLLDDMLDHSGGGTHLAHFDVSYCPKLSAQGVHNVVLRCPAIVSLNLSGCTHLSDANIVDIVSSCAKIVRLELAFCRELTDAVLYAVAKHLSLEELNLSRCVRITDDGVLEVAGQSSVLRRLNVSACKKLGEKSLFALLDGCRLLEELDVTHCPLFSPETLARFTKRKVKVTTRKLEEVLISSAVGALEAKEQQEREEAEQQRNEMSVDALRYMTPERRAKYAKTLAAKPCDSIDGACKMERVEMDGEQQRNDADLNGPLTCHIEQSIHDSTEADELALLRAENALLKKKVKALEKARGDKPGLKLVIDEKEIQQIDILLKKAEDAKMEAMNYAASTSREKLGQDVRVLQTILQKAKAERHAFKKKVKASEDKLRDERAKMAQVKSSAIA